MLLKLYRQILKVSSPSKIWCTYGTDDASGVFFASVKLSFVLLPFSGNFEHYHQYPSGMVIFY